MATAPAPAGAAIPAGAHLGARWGACAGKLHRAPRCAPTRRNGVPPMSYPAPRQTSTLAILALVPPPSSAGPCCRFLGGLGGIIFGHMARGGGIRRSDGQLDGDGLAVTGWCWAEINVMLAVLFVLVIFMFFGGLAWLAALDSLSLMYSLSPAPSCSPSTPSAPKMASACPRWTGHGVPAPRRCWQAEVKAVADQAAGAGEFPNPGSGWPPGWTREQASTSTHCSRWASASSKSAPSPRARRKATRSRACSGCRATARSSTAWASTTPASMRW